MQYLEQLFSDFDDNLSKVYLHKIL